MANYTLIARINAGNGKFPFVTVQFTKNHRPIPIAGATYYLRPCNRGSRTPPIRIGKDVNAAMAALLKAENAQASGNVVAERAGSVSSASAIVLRKTVAEAAQEYIERSREKSRRTFIWLSHGRQSVSSKLHEAVLRRDSPGRHARLSALPPELQITENERTVRRVHRV